MTNKTKITHLKTDHQSTPLGIDADLVHFSWQMDSNRPGAKQKRYQLVVKKGATIVWDSGRVESSLSYAIYCPIPLSERTLYQWQVRVQDERDEWLLSDPATFETGVTHDPDWQKAAFICAKEPTEVSPVFLFEKKLPQNITKARLYITSLGIYQIAINGQLYHEIETEPYMAPGYGNKKVSLAYQSYDILPFLTGRTLHLAVATGNGWYHGMGETIGQPAIKAMVVLTDVLGQTMIYPTEPHSWQATLASCIRKNGVYYGEDYDANYTALTDFYQKEVAKIPLTTCTYPGKILSRQGSDGKLCYQEKLQAKTGVIYQKVEPSQRLNVGLDRPVKIQADEILLVDFGQNATAIPTLTIQAPAKTCVTLKFSEILNDGHAFDDTFHSTKGDGPKDTPYYKNLRQARAQVTFITSDRPVESYRPATTFFGYRYLTIEVDQPTQISNLISWPLSSVSEKIGTLATNNAAVNQLIQNVCYSQLSNYFTTATDCPQRDERLFWSGDTQVFAQSALYNYESVAFLEEMRTIMAENTLIKGYTPMVVDAVNDEYFSTFCAGWSDALVITAWILYQHTGDRKFLAKSYPALLTYFAFLEDHERSENAAPLFGDRNCGDWLSYQGTNVGMMGDYYYAYVVSLLAKIAQALKKQSDQMRFEKKFMALKATFLSNHLDRSKGFLLRSGSTEFENHQFFGQGPGKKGGIWEDNSQTALLWFLKLGFYEDEAMRQEVLSLLIENIRNQKPAKNSIRSSQPQNSLAIGFLGVNTINPILTQFGSGDLAYDLLLQDKIPSWLFEVKAGATTVWERWNSYDSAQGFGDSEMNSFNHYAYGAVIEWLYQYVLGIAADPTQPGFRKIILQPTMDRGEKFNEEDRIDHVCGSYRSPYGKITVKWESNQGKLSSYEVRLPANTEATLYLPIAENQIIHLPAKSVIHNGQPCQQIDLTAGTWQFIVETQ